MPDSSDSGQTGDVTVPTAATPTPLPDLLKPGADAPDFEKTSPSEPKSELVVAPPQSMVPEPPAVPPEPPPQAAVDPGLIVPAKEDESKGGNPPPAGKAKGNKRNIAMGLALVFLLITTGFVFVFVNQQQSLNDIRNRATGGMYGNTNADDQLTTACQSGSTSACNSLCGTPNYPDIQTTCVPPGVGCNMQFADEAANAETCNQWHWTNCIGGGTNGVGCGTGGGGGGGGGGGTPNPTTPPGSTNTPTPTATVTATPTGTPSNTPTGTPPDETPTSTPTATPPGNTSTPTPTQIVYAACNYACTVNADCGGGLVCLDKLCRNASCVESATCSCGGVAVIPTPKIPVAGTGPSVLGATTIAGGFFLLLLGLLF